MIKKTIFLILIGFSNYQINSQNIGTGVYHTIAITDSREILSWGRNDWGQLGYGFSSGIIFEPIKISVNHVDLNEKFTSLSVIDNVIQSITDSGSLYKWSGSVPSSPYDKTKPNYIDKNFINQKKIIKIASSYFGSFILTEENKLYKATPFSNAYSEISSGKSGVGFLDIATGGSHAIAILSDSTLVTWGSNGYGQLGNKSLSESLTPTPVYAGGQIKNKKFVEISARNKHSIALDESGAVYQWGAVIFGQMGNVPQSNIDEPTIVDFSQVQSSNKKIIKIDAGNHFNLAMGEDSSLFSWGSSHSGVLGNINSSNSNTPINVDYNSLLDENEKIRTFSAGSTHSLALTTKGKIIGWGWNGYGSLGINYLKQESTYTPIIIDVQNSSLKDKTPIYVKAGRDCSFAIDENGEIHSWGRNQDGALGLGFVEEYQTPRKLDYFKDVNVKIKSIAGTNKSTYILTQDSEIYFWGMDDNDSDSKLFSLTPKYFNDRYNPLFNVEIDTLVAGWTHVVALTKNGDLYSWGDNSMGAFGTGAYNPNKSSIPIKMDIVNTNLSNEKIVKLAASERGVMALTESGKIFVWGENWDKYIGTLSDDKHIYLPTEIYTAESEMNGEKIIDISAGRFHYLALSETGKLFTWGNNNWGKLGNGTTQSERFPIPVNLSADLSSGESIKLISANSGQSAIVTSKGRVFIWGSQNSTTPILKDIPIETNDEIVKLVSRWYRFYAFTRSGHIYEYNGYRWKFVYDIINVSPVISSLENVTINEDETGTTILSGTDADGDAITYSAASDTNAVTVSVSNSIITLTPNANWHGEATITAYASDGTSTDSTSFKLIVNSVNDTPTPFAWSSTLTDSIQIKKDNLSSTYDLVWDESKDVDGDTIVYTVHAKIGNYETEDILDTTATSYSIPYSEIIEVVFTEQPIDKATVRFTVWASDGTDSVKVEGEDRVLFVNIYDYLSTKEDLTPTEFALHDNYPNPFNPTTKIRFDLPQVTDATLTIYNMMGQKIRTFSMSSLPAGYHTVTWNATNDYGQQVSAGVYLYQLQTKGFARTKKMILLK